MMPCPGIEPRSPVCQAGMLTTTLGRHGNEFNSEDYFEWNVSLTSKQKIGPMHKLGMSSSQESNAVYHDTSTTSAWMVISSR